MSWQPLTETHPSFQDEMVPSRGCDRLGFREALTYVVISYKKPGSHYMNYCFFTAFLKHDSYVLTELKHTL